MENITTAQRNKMAATYGLLAGIIYIVLISASNIFVGQMITFYVIKAIAFILYMVVLGIMLGRIRKENGGFLEFKEAYGAFFIIVLVAGALTYIYNYIYIQYIDPQFMNKIRTATVSFMEKMKAPDDKVEDALRKFDKQVEESKHMNAGKMVMTYLEGVILDCLFGLIVCAIVKKSRPMFDN